MKRYVVKVIARATEENNNFRGETKIHYYGKEQTLLGDESNELILFNMKFFATMARKYGYKRKCDAKRSRIYRYPTNTRYWKETTEIIEIEI